MRALPFLVCQTREPEGCSEEIRTVNEFRVVAVPGNAVIV
jgi:hypothetical protein